MGTGVASGSCLLVDGGVGVGFWVGSGVGVCVGACVSPSLVGVNVGNGVGVDVGNGVGSGVGGTHGIYTIVICWMVSAAPYHASAESLEAHATARQADPQRVKCLLANLILPGQGSKKELDT